MCITQIRDNLSIEMAIIQLSEAFLDIVSTTAEPLSAGLIMIFGSLLWILSARLSAGLRLSQGLLYLVLRSVLTINTRTHAHTHTHIYI